MRKCSIFRVAAALAWTCAVASGATPTISKISSGNCTDEGNTTTMCDTAKGATVTVDGTNFGSGSSSFVMIGAYPCTSIEVQGTTKLTCLLGPGVGASLAVRVMIGSSTSAANTAVTLSYAAPEVTGVSGCPKSGCPRNGSGTNVTLTGTHFGNRAERVDVRVNSEACDVSFVSSTKIQCALPAGYGPARILVSVSGQWSAVRETAVLEYAPCPGGSFLDVNTTVPGLGAALCRSCPAGKFSSANNSMRCTECALGKYCPAGASIAVDCPSGFTCITPKEQVACKSTHGSAQYCPEGAQHCSRDDSLCPAGFVCPNSTSMVKCKAPSEFTPPKGVYCPTGSTNYTLCPKGHYCFEPKVAVPCPVGTYMVSSGAYTSDVCKPCPEGGVCLGRDHSMILLSGYWRGSDNSGLVHKCINPASCMGSVSCSGDPPTCTRVTRARSIVLRDAANEKKTFGAALLNGTCLSDYCVENSSCREGSTGNLCASCVKGYTSNGKGSCDICPDSLTLSYFSLLFGFVLLVILVWLMVKSTISSAGNKEDLMSIMFKIFVSYLQLTSLALRFDLNWPAEIKHFFEVLDSSSSASQLLVSVDCVFQQVVPPGNPWLFYSNSLFMLLLPIIYFIVTALYWYFQYVYHCKIKKSRHVFEKCEHLDRDGDGVVHSKEFKWALLKVGIHARFMELRDLEDLVDVDHDGLITIQEFKTGVYRAIAMGIKRKFIVTMVVGMFLLQPMMSTQVFRLFACKKIDEGPGGRFLAAALDNQCYNTLHNRFLGAGVFFVCFYVLGIPLGTFALLYRARHTLRTLHTRFTLGFLYMGYKDQYYWWPCWVMLRKTAIIFFTLVMAEQDVNTQALCGVVLLIVLVFAHLAAEPFEEEKLDQLELLSLVSCFFTYYSGLFFYNSVTIRTVSSAKAFLMSMTFLLSVSFFLLFAKFLWPTLKAKYLATKHRLKVSSLGLPGSGADHIFHAIEEWRHRFLLKRAFANSHLLSLQSHAKKLRLLHKEGIIKLPSALQEHMKLLRELIRIEKRKLLSNDDIVPVARHLAKSVEALKQGPSKEEAKNSHSAAIVPIVAHKQDFSVRGTKEIDDHDNGTSLGKNGSRERERDREKKENRSNSGSKKSKDRNSKRSKRSKDKGKDGRTSDSPNSRSKDRDSPSRRERRKEKDRNKKDRDRGRKSSKKDDRNKKSIRKRSNDTQ